MRMRHMNHADALRQLAHVTPHALTETPSFISAPRATVSRRAEDGTLNVIFECRDHANDVSYAVEVPYGAVPLSPEQGMKQMCEAAALALGHADRNARAVWN